MRELAGLFSAMSETVDTFRTQHFNQATPEERLRLEELFQQLCDLHDQFTALAISSTLDDMHSSLDRIIAVTSEAKQSLSHLKAIAAITNLVSAATALGTDAATGDYGAIPSAIEQLTRALSQKPSQPDAAL